MRSARSGMSGCSTSTRGGSMRLRSIIMSASSIQCSLSQRCSRWLTTNSIRREPILSSSAFSRELMRTLTMNTNKCLRFCFLLGALIVVSQLFLGLLPAGSTTSKADSQKPSNERELFIFARFHALPGQEKSVEDALRKNHCPDETARTWLSGNSYLPFDQGCAPILHSLALGG